MNSVTISRCGISYKTNRIMLAITNPQDIVTNLKRHITKPIMPTPFAQVKIEK
ncbi:MAG: hypothetical protein ACYCY0_12845 [Acidithiobacillus ferrivorans]